MGDENHGIALCRVFLYKLHQGFRFLRRKDSGGLIHDKKAGFQIKGLQYLHLLLHANRQVRNLCIHRDIKSILSCQLLHFLLTSVVINDAAHIAQDDVFRHRMRIYQGKMLLDHGNAQGHGILWGTYLLFLSIHEYLSFICLIKAVQDLHDRAFSRPVFP